MGMRLSGAAVVVACLAEQGVDLVFGYPGGQVLALYDALYDAPVKHILTVHEQGAVHAADGYARVSGRVGVCIATSGPGATNLITGLANALMDSVPLVAITGQVPTAMLGRDAFQEVDITGISMPVTKHNFLVRDPARLADTLRSAFAIARSGRPGPVLVDIPRDVQTAVVEFEPREQAGDAESRTGDCAALVEQAAAAIRRSRRPVMVLGGGVIRARAWGAAQKVAELFGLPVVSTLMGLGAMPASHPLFLGLTGMHGHKAANAAVHDADLLVVAGSRLSDRMTGDRRRYGDGKTIIHIDIDQAELDKNVTAQIGLTGKLDCVLNRLLASGAPGDTGDWRRKVAVGHKEDRAGAADDSLTAPGIMRELAAQAEGRQVIFATDVGQHQMWAAQHLPIERPGTWVTSGGLGAMGFGLPAAMGAQLAAPDERVVLIAGDGGFKMTGLELYTIAHHKLPVITIIVDNSCLGMVRQWQQLFYKERYAASLAPAAMDFCGLARACGVPAVRAQTPRAFAAALAAAWRRGGPSVIVAGIAADAMVTPMIAPGAGLDEYVVID